MSGRVLKILLTFAQFERELASDRTRDKRAALMRRGMFLGGAFPFGYVFSKKRSLELGPERAQVLLEAFARFPEATA